MDDAINTVFVKGHFGPHPVAYHEAVYKRLIAATAGLKGKEFKRVFEETLTKIGQEAAKEGTTLNKLLTQ